MDGMESKGASLNGGKMSVSGILLRLLGLVLTLTSAIVMGVDKQSKVVPIQLTPTLPPINFSVDAKWHYLSAFVFFVAANIIACIYAAISLGLTAMNKAGKSSLNFLIMAGDVIMVALLFAANGAALAIGLMGYQGNSHVNWNKVCDVFGKFCNQVAASVVISLLGSIVFVLLLVVSISNLIKKLK
ncbi:hypothetical protein ACFE04_014957 [Oxalis oulophora]